MHRSHDKHAGVGVKVKGFLKLSPSRYIRPRKIPRPPARPPAPVVGDVATIGSAESRKV